MARISLAPNVNYDKLVVTRWILYGPLRPPSPYTGMIFGTRAGQHLCPPYKSMIFGKGTHAGRRTAWLYFRKMDPCRTEACMGPPHSEIPCGAALPGAFFSRKLRSLVFCNPKQCFLHSTETIFNGTRLDRRGLKN